MRKILFYIRELASASPNSENPYTQGFDDALALIEEFVLEAMWEEGEDGEET
jgi:hypothetical protein